jgi:hypothetical protein
MTDTVKVLLIGVLLWFALLAYTLYDDWTTWWVSLTRGPAGTMNDTEHDPAGRP